MKSPLELKRIKDAWHDRVFRQIFFLLFLCAILAGLTLTPIPVHLRQWGLLAAIVMGVIFSFWNLRCPDCKHLRFSSWSKDHCPRCQAHLEKK